MGVPASPIKGVAAIRSKEPVPFDTVNECAACGQWNSERRYCDTQHVRGNLGSWLDITKYGDKPDPHLHGSCKFCGFEWLEKVKTP